MQFRSRRKILFLSSHEPLRGQLNTFLHIFAIEWLRGLSAATNDQVVVQCDRICCYQNKKITRVMSHYPETFFSSGKCGRTSLFKKRRWMPKNAFPYLKAGNLESGLIHPSKSQFSIIAQASELLELISWQREGFTGGSAGAAGTSDGRVSTTNAIFAHK